MTLFRYTLTRQGHDFETGFVHSNDEVNTKIADALSKGYGICVFKILPGLPQLAHPCH